MKPDLAAYEDLFGSLADGAPIDWSALEAGARDEQAQRRYRNLRLVARVAELHRTLTLDEDPPAPVDVPASVGGEPPRVWGRLHVGERLASGAFGDLYRARDPQLDRDVALKLLRSRPGDAASAVQLSEAQTLAKVSHPNVVIVHGADVADGRAGLWMELIDGQTLAALAHDRGKLGAGETVSIGRDICRALAAVHGAGLVHGDVKAQNVMREAGGRIVLMDFGAGGKGGVTAAKAGTPLYLAPEVLAGEPPTPQSDLYSLGVLLFVLLTGRYPCRADDLDGLRRAHADDARVYLRDERPDLPDSLVDCVERALQRDPAVRFSTAGAMELALSGAQPQPRTWWRPAVIGALVALAVAAVVGGAAALWPRPPRSLAVLTFASPDPDAAYLVSGLNTDVIRELQRYDVQVKTAASAGPQTTAPDLDQRLNVDTIVAADTRREPSGLTLKVTVRRSGTEPFWTRDYAISDDVMPALAATMARDIASAAGVGRTTGAPPLYQSNPRAVAAYYRGRQLAESRSPAGLMRSLEYFKEALRHDSRYAEAWAGMADTYIALGVPPFGDLRSMEARKGARDAADQALRINPDLAEVETSRAWASWLFDWDWANAENGFKRAIFLNSQYAQARFWYANLLTDLGRFDDARAELTRAQELEPLSAMIHRDFGWIDFMEGRYKDAIVRLRHTLTLDANHLPSLTLLARSLAADGDFAGAGIELEKARLNSDLSQGAYLSFRAYFEAAAGDPRAGKTLAELRKVASSEYVTPYYFALIYTALGQRDGAIAELENAYREQDTTLGSVNIDPRFESLRTDARFQALVTRMRFPALRR